MVNPCKIVNFPCHVRVWHSLDFHGQGRQGGSSGSEPSTNLKSAMRNMLDQGFCSDLTLNFEGKKFNVHRALLSVRSPILAKLITN